MIWQAKTQEEVLPVLLDPAIMSRVMDGMPTMISSVEGVLAVLFNHPDTIIHCWSATGETTARGIFLYLPVNAVCREVHWYTLPQFRGKQGSAQAALSSANSVLIGDIVQKLVAIVPEPHHDVLRFAEKVGFHFEGVSPKSCLIHGQLASRIYLGRGKEG